MATVIAMRELPTLTLFPAPTGGPTRTLSPVEATSWAAYYTAMAPFSGCGIDIELISPNGEWMFCAPNAAVMRRDGHELAIAFGDMKPEWLTRIGPLHWSSDGDYLYFSTGYELDGGCGPIFGDFNGLFRVNLVTGSVHAVLPPLDVGDGLYTYSISPTGRRLAYVHSFSGDNSLLAQIQDLKTGDVQSVELGSAFEEAGGFIWSPDGTKLLVQMRHREDPNPPRCFADKTTVILVDALNKTHEVLFGDYPGDLRVQRWSEDNELRYWTAEDNLVRSYDLDTASYRLVGTATPFP
jgi:hypothetical protein